MIRSKKLIVILGPTGVGKTETAIAVAEHIGSPVLSSDSRQLYKGIPIGTSAPGELQLKAVRHYFIAEKNLSDYYNASMYEEEVMKLLPRLYKGLDAVVMAGGSMMYIDAVCKGIDEIPTVDPGLRRDLLMQYKEKGIDPIRNQLKILDPDFYRQVDLKNDKRIIHALEICLMTGKPYSSLRKGKPKPRPFDIFKIGLCMDREKLYRRINNRVDRMMEEGLLEEAGSVYPLRSCNSLNTVGYKELFDYFDGKTDLASAVERIKQNTRIYSRKQMSWFRRDKDIVWFDPVEKEKIIAYVDSIIIKK